VKNAYTQKLSANGYRHLLLYMYYRYIKILHVSNRYKAKKESLNEKRVRYTQHVRFKRGGGF
jgi:hypothetical protein